MFTGIIEEIGQISSIEKGANSAVLSCRAKRILEGIKVGDSVCVNGVCLTVCSFDKKGFCADVMHETFNVSNLGNLKQNSYVNLERAMEANGRFGGHIVSGHIDGVGKIVKIQKDDNAIRYTIAAKEQILHYIVRKGSIAIDGISLTVTEVSKESFGVSVIPHTAGVTILSKKKEGELVNLENDLIGKYVEKLFSREEGTGKGHGQESRITESFLSKYGF